MTIDDSLHPFLQGTVRLTKISMLQSSMETGDHPGRL